MNTRRRLALSRAAFLLVAGLSLAVLLLMVPINLRTPTLDPQFETIYAVLAGRVPRAAYAAYRLALNYVVALLCVLVGLAIAWRKADDRVAWLAGVVLVTLPITLSLGGYSESWGYYGLPWRRIFFVAREGLAQLGLQAVLLFVLLFPTGRPVRPWLGRLYAVFAAGQGLLAAGQLLSDAEMIFTMQISLVAVMLPIELSGLAYRYWRLSTPLERQQIKWVVIGLSTWVALLFGTLAAVAAADATPAAGVVWLVASHIHLFALALVPLTLAFSVQRYRLWDIDRLVRRSLVYVLVTAALAGLYLGSVIVLQSALRAATGQTQSTVVTVLSTLLMAAAAGPLRTRVQRGLDRRFNRRHYDAARTLEAFGAAVQADTYADLDGLSAQLVGVVQDTLEPEKVSLWLRS